MTPDAYLAAFLTLGLTALGWHACVLYWRRDAGSPPKHGKPEGVVSK